MKSTWLHKNGRNNLIVFCNGWGMDGNPFQSLASVDFDVYMLYDYRQVSMPAELEKMFQRYDHIHLISWSMGVWIGQKLFADIADVFERTLALNGTLCPINDQYGIPEEIFAETLNGFGEVARHKFYRRMCREKTNLRMFMARQPQRSLDDQKEELAALKEMVDCIAVNEALYKEIIISEYDWIIPSENQKNFWLGKPVTLISGFHYLFNLWQSWDHLLSYSDSIPQNEYQPGTEP